VTQLHDFLMPPTLAIAQAEVFDSQWLPKEGWQII
jgi:hypothetical protein